MVGDLKIQKLTHHAFDLLYSRVAKFNYFFTIYTNDMVMLFITVAFFVLCQVLAKLVLLNQVAGNEQFKGIIYGSPADVEAFPQDIAIQRFGFKMVGARIDFLQDDKPFVGFTKVFLL